jgi:hypothetical protein
MVGVIPRDIGDHERTLEGTASLHDGDATQKQADAQDGQGHNPKGTEALCGLGDDQEDQKVGECQVHLKTQRTAGQRDR